MRYGIEGFLRWWSAWARVTPGALMCHPIALAALALLLLNDHILKTLAPGLLTGKLSDVAGLAYFPLLLVAVVELGAGRLGRLHRNALLLAAISATAIVFACAKSLPTATAVYNEALGSLQWVLSGGPITGREPTPTGAVTDASDLLAMPALLLAWLVGSVRAGTPRPARRRQLPALSLAILIVAGLASVATSPAMESAGTTVEERVELTADLPAVVRHYTFEVTNRDTVSSMHLFASAYSERREGGIPVREETRGVLVTMAADPLLPEITRDLHTYMSPTLDVLELCRERCRHGLWVVVRLEDQGALANGDVLETTLAVSFHASGEEGTDELDMDLSLTQEADRARAVAPVVRTARATGQIRVSSEDEFERARLTISLPPAALAGPLAFPLVGTIYVSGVSVQASDHDNAHTTNFAFASDNLDDATELDYSFFSIGDWIGNDPVPTAIDLLPLCRPNETCVIDVTLESHYDASLNSPDFDPENAPPGFVVLRWDLSVRLEAFDGRSLSEQAITITAAD